MNNELPGDDMRRDEGADLAPPLASPRREASLKLDWGGLTARPGHFSQGNGEWMPEKISALTALWNEGVPVIEIGNRLGVTKNAVVGKAHRLKLPKRNSPIRPSKKPPEPKLLGLADLQPDQCRWPEGEPREEGFHFCGDKIVAGKPYCKIHCARAYERKGTLPAATKFFFRNEEKAA
jgi:GcrA cell cycle regulator